MTPETNRADRRLRLLTLRRLLHVERRSDPNVVLPDVDIEVRPVDAEERLSVVEERLSIVAEYRRADDVVSQRRP